MIAHLSPLTDPYLHPLRQQFPTFAHKRYFNYGGQGPLPQSALKAIQQAHLTLQTEGPFSATAKAWMQQTITSTREAFATLLQVPATTITLTESVSVGCNIPLWGMDWQPGDRILMTDCEHPGVVAAIQEISRRFHVAVDVCPLLATAQSGDPVAVIEAALRPQTRLLVISHILWNTGQVLPLAAIVRRCHRHAPHPVWVLVDAAQSVGMMPLNLPTTDVDFYAFTGHKWCCGPAGLGGLYVNPERQAAIAPTFIGWRGITVDAQAHPTGWETGGKRYEVATSDYPLMSGLQAALQFHSQVGPSAERYERICQLSQQLWQRLQTHPRLRMVSASPLPSGLVAWQILDDEGQPSPPAHVRLVQDLEAEGTLLRILLHPHCVRACVHYLTLASEVVALGDRILQWLADVET